MIVAGPALLLFMWTLLPMDRARVEGVSALAEKASSGPRMMIDVRIDETRVFVEECRESQRVVLACALRDRSNVFVGRE